MGKIKVVRKPTNPFTREEFDRIIAATYHTDNPRIHPTYSETDRIRLRTMVLLLRWSGLRSRVPSRSVEFLGESDEKPFRPADVAEPIRVLIPDYFAYELRAALAKPAKRLVDVVYGEHDAEVA